MAVATVCLKRSTDPAEAAAAVRRNVCSTCMPIGMGRCPIGPEDVDGRGWYVVGHSIQVIETGKAGRLRWRVAVYFSGRKFDLRYPVASFKRRWEAVERAKDYGLHYCGGGAVERWCGGDWLVRNDRLTIVILVVSK